MPWVLFSVGGGVCLLNAYASWLRYPLHLARGGRPEEYSSVSGAPLIGSLFVALAWFGGLRNHDSLLLDVAALVLVAVDTGGLHWFVAVMVHQRIRRARGGR